MTGHMLQDALESWTSIRARLIDAGHLYILSDFDGTLSPLVDTPAAASIDTDVRMVLRRLAANRRITIAVLSGRAVTDLQSRVGLPLVYAGDHGLEIRGLGFNFTAPGADRVRAEIPDLSERIRQHTAHVAGALVECKRLSASLHFRQVCPELLPELASALESCVDQRRYEIRSGKCVWEVRPRVAWNKGDAARWILHRHRAAQQHAVCIGDDHTDADMFRRLPGAVNVQIGFDGFDSGAEYWLPQSEVAQFLLYILALVTEQSRPAASTTYAAPA